MRGERKLPSRWRPFARRRYLRIHGLREIPLVVTDNVANMLDEGWVAIITLTDGVLTFKEFQHVGY